MALRLINSERFFLPGTQNRFMHFGTAHSGVREFMCFIDTVDKKVYIEEITGGHLEFINDDKLAEELAAFFTYHKLMNMDRPVVPDKTWNNLGRFK